MRNLIKIFGIIVLSLVLNSCGVQWQYNALNTAGTYDEIYGVEVEEINTVSQLNWKFRNDFRFSNDYYYFFATQPYSFFHYNYYYNRLYRWGWTNPLDYYLNWHWGWNSGYSYWSPFNQYPWYGNWNSNYWWHWQWNRPYGYSYIYGPRTTYLGNVYGRRGLSNRDRVNITRPQRSVVPTKPNRITTKPVTQPRPNTNTTRPHNTIRVKPPTNTRPTYNRPSNSRPPVYNNNRPSNNSKPVISKPSRPVSAPRSNSKRGGQ